jgi:hypothetical protein
MGGSGNGGFCMLAPRIRSGKIAKSRRFPIRSGNPVFIDRILRMMFGKGHRKDDCKVKIFIFQDKYFVFYCLLFNSTFEAALS